MKGSCPTAAHLDLLSTANRRESEPKLGASDYQVCCNGNNRVVLELHSIYEEKLGKKYARKKRQVFPDGGCLVSCADAAQLIPTSQMG